MNGIVHRAKLAVSTHLRDDLNIFATTHKSQELPTIESLEEIFHMYDGSTVPTFPLPPSSSV
ncbi:hypothetical protein GOP47_0012777 [Adiantum capillus-veneris]|uniref:Uncharacterized protein n=1 Tax=Adiantum capillus-veneris TaxID=13818 RepID=A0A9D4ZH50_ADICA|nr:hypothetical protein GOP47_0012777 [Adiantum capillus-veneris]